MSGLSTPALTYRHVSAKHPIARAQLKDPAASFFKGMLDPCPHAVVAYDDGEPVAWVRYLMGRGGHTVYAAGTWVDEHYRDFGVAQTLWGRVFTKRPTIKRVVIRTISTGGRVLVGSMVRWFPKLSFEVLP